MPVRWCVGTIREKNAPRPENWCILSKRVPLAAHTLLSTEHPLTKASINKQTQRKGGDETRPPLPKSYHQRTRPNRIPRSCTHLSTTPSKDSWSLWHHWQSPKRNSHFHRYNTNSNNPVVKHYNNPKSTNAHLQIRRSHTNHNHTISTNSNTDQSTTCHRIAKLIAQLLSKAQVPHFKIPTIPTPDTNPTSTFGRQSAFSNPNTSSKTAPSKLDAQSFNKSVVAVLL